MINFVSKINGLLQEYTLKLDFKVSFTDIKAHKIKNSILEMFKIVRVNFEVENILDQA